MRYLILLFLLPVFSQAQHKGDSKIVVTTQGTTINDVAAVFYDAGYSMEEKDESVGFLMTKPKEIDKFSVQYKIKASVKDNKITLSAVRSLGGIRDPFENVIYSGGPKSIY